MPDVNGFYGAIQCPDDPDGFYVVGGWEAWWNNRNDVWHYDANIGWAELANYPEEMGLLSATCYQGYIYAAGGNLEGEDTSNHFYQYEISSDTADAPPEEVLASTLRVESLRDPNIMDSVQIFTTVLQTPMVDVSPDELSSSGIYGEIITYTLAIRNLGNITDTYALTYTGNTWDVSLPVTSLELGIGESADVVVTVTVPPDAWLGDSDILTLTATSTLDPMVSDSATITTTTFWYRTLIPLGMKN